MGQKMHSFFFHELQLIRVLFLICDSYMSWSTRFLSIKLCIGFSIFDSVSFLLKFKFLFKCMDFLTLQCHNSFQKYNNRKATHSFAPKLLIFKLSPNTSKTGSYFTIGEVVCAFLFRTTCWPWNFCKALFLKFNDICFSWSSPKTILETNFLN